MTPKTIVITGASSGLGAALARTYAQPGMVLGLLGRHAERLENVARLCRQQGAVVETAVLDVMDVAAMTDFLTRFDRSHPIDLCIANAGISAGSGGGGETLVQATRIFDVNLHGVLNTIHPVMDCMIPRKYGQIAIVSSIAGFRGLPTAPAYTASKAAVRVYGQALSGLLSRNNIHVSVICPGFIKTPLTDVNPFPMPLMMSADKAAGIIKNDLRRRKTKIVFPLRLALIARLQNLLPDLLLNWIYTKIPNKPAE